MKKSFYVPVILATLALLLAACGGGTTATPLGSPAPTSGPLGVKTPGTGGAYPEATASLPPGATPAVGGTATNETPAGATITLYFDNSRLNPGAASCNQVFPVQRAVSAGSPNDLNTVLPQLFQGPTAEEQAQGYTSVFSPKTAGILIWAKVQGNTAYINLQDLRSIIPNASTSCGSAAFFAQADTTVKAATSVSRVIYAINGDPAPFYEWMQIGCAPQNDNCDRAPFAGP